jgi:hypothetical protein
MTVSANENETAAQMNSVVDFIALSVDALGVILAFLIMFLLSGDANSQGHQVSGYCPADGP